MKYLIPIVSLGGIVTFLIYQEIAIANLRDEIETMVAEVPDSSTSQPRQPQHQSQESILTNWKLFGNADDPGDILKQRAALAVMDRDELLESLDHLDTLKLDEDLDNDIRFSLLQFLASLDPATTLTLADALSDQNSLKVLNFKLNTFGFLTQQDSAKAAAWFDQKIADQAFQTTRIFEGNNPRFKFEKLLISRLLDTNSKEAQARVSRLNDKEKQWLFSRDSEYWLQDGRVPEAFLDFARANQSSETAPFVVGIVLGAQKVTSLSDATTLLDQSKLSESERGHTARNLLLNHIRHDDKTPDLEKVYQWTLAEDGGESVHLMTHVFNELPNRLGSSFKTEEIIASVFSLADSTGDQNILENYLKHRSGVIGKGLERETDAFKDQDLAKRFRSALQR